MPPIDQAWVFFFGRLHPLMLHLPIGLVLGLVAFEAWGTLRKRARLVSSQRRFLAFLLFASALVSTLSGWQLGDEYGYSTGDFVTHRGFGIAFAACTLLVWCAALLDWRGAYRIGLGLALVSAGVAGHFGAEMTHGEGFLFEPFEEAAPRTSPPADVQPAAPIDAAAGAPIAANWYDTRIAPIFEGYCIQCHGEKKQKGELALHAGELVLEGGEFGAIVVPGEPDESALLRHLRLPLEAEDHMPPKSKRQPTASEIDELARWVAAGASLDAPLPAVEGESSSAPVVAEERPVEIADPEPAPASELPREAMAALGAAQVHVEVIDPERQLLWIDFRSRPATDDAFVAEQLTGLAEFVVELSLAGTAVSDESLALVAEMSRLELLDLSRTACSAAGLAQLARLEKLHGLNLTATELSDEAVDALLALPALERVDLWKTAVSPEALERLRFARPELDVQAGDHGPNEPLEDEAPVSFSKHPELDAVNTVCPVTGKPVDPRYRIVYEERVIGFCCPNCPGAFLEAPDDYPLED